MSHVIDLVHWLMDVHFPKSVTAHGGIFAWRDGRENPDTFQALLEYPKGFMVSYATSFGNDSESFTRYMRSEEHTSELQSQSNLVCRLLLEKKKKKKI